MNTGELVTSLISGVMVLLLAWIARRLGRIGGDFHKFMAEHIWLISTSLWTRDKVVKIMASLNMPMDNPPPSDLPERKP
jgi:hypothetical protein